MATAKKTRVAGPARKASATQGAAKSSDALGKQVASAPAMPEFASGAKAAPDKPKRAKPVRDSFTIPKAEYAVLQELKQRAAKLGRPAKKSEVLRAGVNVLAAMGDAAFTAALATVSVIKTGRPSGA